MTLKERYRHRDLLEELSRGFKSIRCGYLTRALAEQLRWICLVSYEEITKFRKEGSHA